MTQHVIGWWHFDSERIAMIHTLTGQSVRYIGAATSWPAAVLSNSGNRQWMRFEYEDRNTHYPVLVEWRNVPGHGRPLVWRVDHDRSARLWRRSSNVKAAYPRYGLWRRVDDCLIDAFSSWPLHPTVGRPPTCIAVNAGWLNGVWTEQFYRATWCFPARSPVALDPDIPIICALDALAPSPWEYVAPSQNCDPDLPAPRTWDVEPTRTARELERVMPALPRMMTRDGVQSLVAIPRREDVDPEVHQRLPIYRARLLYADDDFIADAMVADVGKDGSDPFMWSISQRVGGTIGLRHRADGNSISAIRMEYPGLGMSWNRLPNWVSLRLAHSLIDARLSHPELGIGFSPKSDEAVAVFAEGDPQLLALQIPCGGGLSDQRLYAATSLREPNERSRNFLTSQFFDEERDGIIRAATAVPTIGYWSYDPETHSLINQKSDQRLTFVGSHPLDGAEMSRPARSGGQSLRFVYSDSCIEYSLLVRSEEVLKPWGLGCTWHIDHVASARIVRNERHGSPVPVYGLWRRVDSCALDALLCWPEIDLTGPAPTSIEMHGGWFNGGWADRLHRSASRGEDSGFNPPDGIAEAPFIELIDAEPSVWTFVDTIEMAGQADLANIQEFAPGKYFLPHDSPLTGFEHRMPHLLRSDGKAVIFPAGCHGSSRSRDSANTWFVYADEQVFFFVAGYAGLTGWSPQLGRLGGIGLRHEYRFDAGQPGGLPADLFVQRKSRYSYGDNIRLTKNPSPSLAQRITTALLDASLIWQRKSGVVSEVPERIIREQPWTYGDPKDWQKVNMVPARTICVNGGYIGGLFNLNYRLSAELKADGR